MTPSLIPQNCNSICPPSPSPFLVKKNHTESYSAGFRIAKAASTSSLDEGVEEITTTWEGDGFYLSLIYHAGSFNALSFIDEFAVEINRKSGRTNKPSKQFKLALAALMANLLRIDAKAQPSYGYHGMSPDAFRLLQVGYRPFRHVTEGMEALGYLRRELGYKEHSGPFAKAVATRFKATPKLIAEAASYGIVPADWKTHFHRLPRPKAIPNPIVLKADCHPTGKGKRMAVDRRNPVVAALAKPLDELNAYFYDVVIEPDRHYAFYRIFAKGVRGGGEAYGWNHGARIYSQGDSYQHMPEKERTAITINGEATVELDIKASHITILHAKMNVDVPNYRDPYSIDGFDRGAIKTFVTMTLGWDRFHADWTDASRESYAKGRIKRNLAPLALPPFEKVKEATLRAIPLLDAWPAIPYRWGDLQFIESEAVLEAVHTLAIVHDVPALPVHDSIIVPVSKRALAGAVLAAAFEKHSGMSPFIEAKG